MQASADLKQPTSFVLPLWTAFPSIESGKIGDLECNHCQYCSTSPTHPLFTPSTPTHSSPKLLPSLDWGNHHSVIISIQFGIVPRDRQRSYFSDIMKFKTAPGYGQHTKYHPDLISLVGGGTTVTCFKNNGPWRFLQSSFFILRFLRNAESLLGIQKVDNLHICFHSKTHYGSTINTECRKQE